MKRLIIQLFIFCLAFNANAQREIAFKDANFKFTPGFFSEREWRILYRKDTTDSYSFGYTYIDKNVGFIFQQVGSFKIDTSGNYILDPASLNQHRDRQITHRYKAFSSVLNLWPMAFIAPAHFKELHINGEPDWIKQYYIYTDTLEHNYLWGCIYLDAGNSYKAIPYLEKVWQINPHYKDVERNLAFAYAKNEQYDKAIVLINNALVESPGNLLFYLSLYYTYEMKEDWQMCLQICKIGLKHAPVEKSESKAALAIQMGNAYSHLNNIDEATSWWAKAKTYDPNPNRGTF